MKTWWLEAKSVRAYHLQDQARLFKWAVFEREGEMQAAAMPYDIGLAFHMDIIAELALRKFWCDEKSAKAFLKRQGGDFPEAGVRVYGGGMRFENGTTRNFSYRFGPVPDPLRARVEEALGI